MGQLITAGEAVDLVHDGYTLALGGNTLYRRPAGFVLELLRRPQPPRNLTLLSFTAGYESDLLVGAGCVSTVRSAYFGLEAFGLAPMFTQKAQQGQIRIMEETEASIAMGIRAQLAGVSFMPSTAWIGTDLLSLRPDVRTVIDPYTGEELVAFPAIRCDVAVIHALESDQHGNVRINNNLGIDPELVYLANTVIVTVERIVSQVLPAAGSTVLPSPAADFIVEMPRGAWPTSCYPMYALGGAELMKYVDLCNAGRFDDYLHGVLAASR